jgi:hypothetical protein
MKTNQYLAILILISLLINVGLGWYIFDISNQLNQQKSDYNVVNTNNQVMKHYIFLLLKNDILIGSSNLLNISANLLNSTGERFVALYNIDQVLASFRYFDWSAQNLGSAYINMTNYVSSPKASMLDNLVAVRVDVFYSNYTQNDIDYLWRVTDSLSIVADNLQETGVGQFSITDIDVVVTQFYLIENILPSGQ